MDAIASASGLSCVDIAGKFVALATRHGTLHVVDHQGNEIKKFSLHSGRISQVSVDEAGEHAATCADDNTVGVVDLFEDRIRKHSFGQPIEAVALDPEYKDTGLVVVGGFDGRLMLRDVKRGSWSWPRTRDEVLFSGEGTILDVQWRKKLIAWVCYDGGLKILDTASRRLLPFVQTSTRKQEFSRGCRPCLVWQSDSVLLLGWGNGIKVVAVREVSSQEESMLVDIAPQDLEDFKLSRDTVVAGMRYVEVVSTITTAYDVCGIAPYGLHAIVVLGSDRRERHPKPPQLEVITWKKSVLHSESLPSIFGYEQLKPDDYGLASSQGERQQLYYILSPKTMLVHELNVEPPAGSFISHCSITIFEVMLNSLAASSDFDDHRKLLSHLRSWPRNLYSDVAVAASIDLELKLQTKKSTYLQEALKDLYIRQRRFQEALNLYLDLGDVCVFQLIEQRSLHGALAGKIVALVKISEMKAVELLVQSRSMVPAFQVVSELRAAPGSRRVLDSYLWRLFKQDPEIGKEFHSLQVELHADFRQSCLLEFLKTSKYYDMASAFEVCSRKRQLAGMVLIQARRGKYSEAVELMVKSKEIGMLMDVIAEFDGVWKLLVARSRGDPKLMEAVSQHPVGQNHLLSLTSTISSFNDRSFNDRSFNDRSFNDRSKQKIVSERIGELEKIGDRKLEKGSSSSGTATSPGFDLGGDMEDLMDDIWFFNSVLNVEGFP